MTDQLSLYNLALVHLRERRIASLAEPREPQRVLSDLYSQVVAECLEEGLWNFMVRAISTDASTTLTPAFGYNFAFPIPNDWVRTIMISTVDTFTVPLLEYMEETGVWYANWSPLFVRYLSDDPQYGMDLGAWPASFTKFVSLALAEAACARISGSNELLEGPNGIAARCRRAKIHAKSKDAMDQPPGTLPTGTWARSRRGFLRGIYGPDDDMGADLAAPGNS